MYPEHEKLAKISKISQVQGEFAAWLSTKVHLPGTISELLAEYHGIDQEKLEVEKRQMLRDIRSSS